MRKKPLNPPREDLLCQARERNCPWKGWGNSILHRNIKFWKCAYCGKTIRDGMPFHIMRINTDEDYILDTEFCQIQMVQKLEREKIEKERRL